MKLTATFYDGKHVAGLTGRQAPAVKTQSTAFESQSKGRCRETVNRGIVSA
jgi:hypothetical protein